MSLTKIHELPVMDYFETKDTDIFVIENARDTYQISLADMKLLLSNDAKILGIYNELSKAIQSINTRIDDMHLDNTFNDITANFESILQTLSRNNQSIVELQNSVEVLNTRINSLDQRATILEENVSNINIANNNFNELINDINTKLDDYKTDIDNLKTSSTDISTIINQIKEDMANIDSKIQDMNSISMDTLANMKSELQDEFNGKYEEVMQIIDDNFHQTPIIC